MKINLNLLPIYLDEFVEIPKSYYEDTCIKDLSLVKFNGVIKYNLSDEVLIEGQISGVMTLSDAVTNEDIKKDFLIDISYTLDEFDKDNAKFYEKSQNTLDKIEFLWENIILEVPIRLTNSPGINLKGNGWELNRKIESDGHNPMFDKLNELFKGGE